MRQRINISELQDNILAELATLVAIGLYVCINGVDLLIKSVDLSELVELL